MDLSRYEAGVWLIDFEFHPAMTMEGNNPFPVCLVVTNFSTGDSHRYWRNDLQRMQCAPFPTGRTALCVAYFASAEINCFIALGWATPTNLLDLYVEFRCITNGRYPVAGNGLLGALVYYGIAGIAVDEKIEMRELILGGGPWNYENKQKIFNYCESDVKAVSKLLLVMAMQIDGPLALLRGRYMTAVARIESNGTPVDGLMFQRLKNQWERIRDDLIGLIDKDFQVFEGRTFKMHRWERYLRDQGIPWPLLASGRLDMTDDTFADMSKSYPQLSPLRELRTSLSRMRGSELVVGSDDRNRALLSPFKSKTGRNQPSGSKFIFGPSAWIRALIKPAPGWGLAYIDWSQQEFGIAAALSDDASMIDAYLSGDPYLEFAKQAGAVPQSATKQTHSPQRDQFKACALAVQYGMGPESLSIRINQPVARARQLLELHHRTYKRFWRWSDAAVDEAVLSGRLWSAFGWQIHTSGDPNPRSLRNFPMQANGAEMLRIACVLLTECGIRVCAPVHDALLVEAPLIDLDKTVIRTQKIMAEASRIVLPGFELRSDAKVVRYPNRYMDDRGIEMWNSVMKLIGEPCYG